MREHHSRGDEISECIAVEIRIRCVVDQRPIEIELTGIDQFQRRVCYYRLTQGRRLEHGSTRGYPPACRIARAEPATPDHFSFIDERERQSRDHRAVHQGWQTLTELSARIGYAGVSGSLGSGGARHHEQNGEKPSRDFHVHCEK